MVIPRKDLVRCYEDAALQRYLMRPRLEDKARSDDGWSLFYAADSNVVASYIYPVDRAQSSSRRAIGLGEVFRDDTQDSKENIARLISDFVIFELDRQLVVFPSIAQEIKQIYLNFADQFLTLVPPPIEIDAKLLARLERSATQRHKQVAKEALADALRVDLSGVEAARRIRKVTSLRRILGSDMVTATSHSAALAAALKQDTGTDRLELTWRTGQWIARLEKIGRPTSPAAHRDAEALARLQICNERLAARGVREKLIYVSADNSLFVAGEDVPCLTDAGASTFTKEFLRHPRAFLDDPDVLRPSKSAELLEGKTLYDWLTILFEGIEGYSGEVRADKQGRVRLSALTLQSINSVASKRSKAGEEIVKTWNEYAREAFYDAPPGFVQRLLDSLASPVARDLIEQHVRELRNAVEAAWDFVMQVSAGAAFALEVTSPEPNTTTLPSRETPRLVFEGRSALQTFLAKAGQWLTEPEQFDQKLYASLRREVQKEYDGEYGDYMAHAYLMAQQLQWKSAQILAALATDKVCAVTPKSSLESNGRESSYLEAYCGRLTSSSKSDLDRATASIQRALKIADQERSVTEKSGAKHDCAVERFQVEQLVIQMTSQLYDWREGLDVNDSLVGLRMSFYELGQATFIRIAERAREGIPPPYDPEMIIGGLHSALARCYRSGLGLSLQLGLVDPVARSMLEGLKSICATRHCPSQFANFVLSLGDLLLNDQRLLKGKLKRLAELEKQVPVPVLPYDSKRYATMLSVVKNLLTSKSSLSLPLS